jgi:pentapeptide MXKDX repeat protein
MTMQAEQLIGTRVTGGDGQVVGTVQQIFNDDRDGTPVWARIKAGTRERFVPLAGSKVTKNGLSVPYDAQQIMSSPDIGADRHMSAAQTEQLRSYFGLSVPAQGGPPDEDTQRGGGRGDQAMRDEARSGQTEGGQAPQDQGQAGGIQGNQAPEDEAQTGQAGRGTQDQTPAGGTRRDQALRDETEGDRGPGGRADENMPDQAAREQAMRDDAMREDAMREDAMREDAMREDAMREDAMREDAARGGGQRGETQRGETQRGETQRGETQRGETQRGQTVRGEAAGDDSQAAADWLIRAEERLSTGTEAVETGRARLHKYVDVEPVEQAFHVYHEEYEIERLPIGADEQIPGVIGESVQEVILYEERAVFRKEAVPVERVRLIVKRVGEDRTFRDEIRKERVEVEVEDDGDGGREGQRARQVGQAQEGRHRR